MVNRKLTFAGILLVLALAACDNGTTSVQTTSATYISYDTVGNEYKLVLHKSANRVIAYNPQAGDRYTLTVTNRLDAALGKSTGRVVGASGREFTLEHNRGDTFTVTIIEDGIETITGDIPIDSGGALVSPGQLNPDTDNTPDPGTGTPDTDGTPGPGTGTPDTDNTPGPGTGTPDTDGTPGPGTGTPDTDNTPVSGTGTPVTAWYDANSSATAFIITNPDELAGLAKLVNSGVTFAGKTISLDADLNLSVYGASYNGGKGWIPIGLDSTKFSGTFDGRKHKITGLYINTTTGNYIGLFGSVSGGTVKNLGIEGANINGGSPGGVVGYVINGMVQGCYFKGSVGTVISNNFNTIAGGVAGVVYDSMVQNCHSTGTVSGATSAGGVVGLLSNSTVQNCYSTSAITITRNNSGNFSAGGVVGSMGGNGNDIVFNCYSTGDVNGANGHGGGVVGYNGGGTISNCYATGSVNGTYAGGVVSINYTGAVSNCYSTGKIDATGKIDNTYVGGGIVAVSYRDTVKNCVALNPSVKGTNKAGRIIGAIDDGFYTDNLAFTGMNVTGSTGYDGYYEDVTAAEIRGDGTIGNRFTRGGGWTTANGKLPGLFGQTVDLPAHLR